MSSSPTGINRDDNVAATPSRPDQDHLDVAEKALRLAQMKLSLANRPQATLREKLDLQTRAEVRQHISTALRALGRHS